MSIFQIISSVPDVIWSGVIASVLTLSGVLISNGSNTARLKMQLKHDADEKAKERTSSMRRDVYLKAAEELVKLNAHLASLPQQDLSKGNFGEGFIGFQSAAARLQLVAEPKTTLLALKLSGAYGELFFELAQHLLPLGKAKADIKIADDLYNHSNSEVQRVLAAMVKLNETGKPDSPAFESMQQGLRFHQEQAAKYSSDRSAAWKAFNEASTVFQRHLFSRIRDIAPQQMALVVEIRRDLSLHGDLSAVETQMANQLHRMEEKLNGFIDSLGNDHNA